MTSRMFDVTNLSAFTLTPVSLSMLNVKEGRCEYQLFKTFGLTRREIEARSTDYTRWTLLPLLYIPSDVAHNVRSFFKQQK